MALEEREQGRDGHRRLEVWTRDLSPPPDDPRRATLARLRAFEREGVVDEVAVRVWGTYAPSPSEPDEAVDDSICRQLAEFQAWAERRGHTLEPAFQRVDRSSIASEASEPATRLPLLCVAAYEDERLVGVFPCTTDEGPNTVGDCLDRLERGALYRRFKASASGLDPEGEADPPATQPHGST